MKTTTLLNDILAEGDYADFREALAARIQAEARRKRFAHTSRWLALAACVAIALSLFRSTPPKAVQVTRVSEPAYVLHTSALAENQILATHSAAVIELATDHSQIIPSISDSELLNLFPNHATALASIGHAPKRFFFINPKDAAAFTASN